jgi:hypothetical protein
LGALPMLPLDSALVTKKLPTGLAITTTTAAAAVVATTTAAATAITTAAKAATVTTVTTATATAATTTIFSGTSFVDVQSATIDFLAVELSDRRLTFFFGRHFDEAKTT